MGWRARIAAAKTALAASRKTGIPVDQRVEQIAATPFDDLLAAERRDPEFARHYAIERPRIMRSLCTAYSVVWSPEDGEWVGLAAEFPSLSWLDPDPIEAVRGIIALVDEVAEDLDEGD